MIAVLKTNILVSAFKFGGNPGRLIDMACSGKLNVTVSLSILSEFSRILKDKFGWKDAELEAATAKFLR